MAEQTSIKKNFAYSTVLTVAIRETTAAAGDKEKLSKVFSIQMVLHLISTLVAMAALVVCIFVIPRFYEHK